MFEDTEKGTWIDMAMKKRSEPQKEPDKKPDDSVVYRAGAALLITCAVLLGLQVVNGKYPLIDYFMAVRAGLLWAAGIFALVAVAGLVGVLGLRKKSRFWRVVSPAGLFLGIALSLSCLFLYKTGYQNIPLLFYLCIAVAVLYLIKLLYQPEFFLLSMINICAGGVFYRLSRIEDAASLHAMEYRAVLAVVTVVCALAVFLAGKHDGKLSLFGKSWRVMSRGGTPLLIYITGAVWLVCLAASVFLGPVLSYYCIFAAVAFELAAAVYYTMKLA